MMLSARSWYCYIRQVCVPYAQVVVQRERRQDKYGRCKGDTFALSVVRLGFLLMLAAGRGIASLERSPDSNAKDVFNYESLSTRLGGKSLLVAYSTS
jgi:hypothetical protein